MARLWPASALLLGLLWLTTPAPAGWTLPPAAWEGPALLLLLAGIFGLLHQSSGFLQARFVGLIFGLTRNLGWANRAYFAIMRPGVLVHELAHAIAAALVGGRIVAFNILETSMVPGAGGGQVRLGHVTYAIPGSPRAVGTRLKDAFVGFAPLPFGLLLLAGALALSGADLLRDPLAALPAAAGTWRFWLALLVVVEVADHMTPSTVDRRNWPVALLLGLAGLALAIVALILFHLALPADWWPPVRQAGLLLALVLGVPIVVNLALGLIFWLPARLLRR